MERNLALCASKTKVIPIHEKSMVNTILKIEQLCRECFFFFVNQKDEIMQYLQNFKKL